VISNESFLCLLGFPNTIAIVKRETFRCIYITWTTYTKDICFQSKWLVSRKRSTRLNKSRQGKRELFISCLGCSEKAKNVTYKGT